jgi:hypothetical protein
MVDEDSGIPWTITEGMKEIFEAIPFDKLYSRAGCGRRQAIGSGAFSFVID